MNMFFNIVVAIHFTVKRQLWTIAVSLTETAILKIGYQHFVRLVSKTFKFNTTCTLPMFPCSPLPKIIKYRESVSFGFFTFLEPWF